MRMVSMSNDSIRILNFVMRLIISERLKANASIIVVFPTPLTPTMRLKTG